MDSGRSYPHFCMTARALEEVGERWSLLVVRDLMLGPRRFTDLSRSLGGITPARLTARLRRLEAADIVVREESAAGREVWYRLTGPARSCGRSSRPWGRGGFRHAAGAPRPGESVHPDHVMLLNKVWLNGRMRKPRKPLVWVWRLGEESYTLRFDGSAWGLERGEGDGAAVSVVATPEAWARFLTSPPDARRLPADGIKIEGTAAAVRSFARTHEADIRAAAGERGKVRSLEP
jgi:DNA-binding HxlR family transcriptional regulator